MEKSNENKNDVDFVGTIDPISGILILWEIKEADNKIFEIKDFPEFADILSIRMPIKALEGKARIRYLCGYYREKFIFGLNILQSLDNRLLKVAIDSQTIENNIFTIYRIAKALQCLPAIDFPEDIIKISYAVNPRHEFHGLGRDWLSGIIGSEKYEKVMKAVPSNLEEAVERLLETGAKIDKSQFEDEIERGAIKSRELMKILKIHTPEEKTARKARFENLVEPYWEYAVYYFGYKNYPAMDEKTVTKLKQYLYEVKARGIDDYVDAAAIAIIMFYREAYVEKNKPESTADAEMIEKRKKTLHESMSKIVKEVSEDFAACFKEENRSAEELLKRYENLLKNAEIMEPVDLLN